MGWDGMVWCLVPARYRWPLLESGRIGHPGKIEHDLIGLVAKFGYGWAVYVRRAISAGKREYFFYYGGDASIIEALPELQAIHPEYRIEFDTKDDPQWSFYFSWLKEAPNA